MKIVFIWQQKTMDSEGVGKADEDIKVYKKYRQGELKG